MRSSVHIYTKLRNRFSIIHPFSCNYQEYVCSSIGRINKRGFLFSLKQNCTYLRWRLLIFGYYSIGDLISVCVFLQGYYSFDCFSIILVFFKCIKLPIYRITILIAIKQLITYIATLNHIHPKSYLNI